MNGSVYILKSKKNGSFYVGSTIQVQMRLMEHNDGRVTATKYLRPWQVVLEKQYSTTKQARQVEYKIKKLKSRKIIEQMIKDHDIKIMGP